jgi:hypothetical protein
MKQKKEIAAAKKVIRMPGPTAFIPRSSPLSRCANYGTSLPKRTFLPNLWLYVPNCNQCSDGALPIPASSKKLLARVESIFQAYSGIPLCKPENLLKTIAYLEQE